MDNPLYRKLEELSLNAWPSFRHPSMTAGQPRYANGYTKRSNCVMPLYESHGDAEGKIRYCEQIYSVLGLDVVFKITPFASPSHLDSLLEGQGYRIVDPVYVKTASLAELPVPTADRCQIDDHVNERWLEELTQMMPLSDQHRETAVKLLNSMPPLKCFVTVYSEDGTPSLPVELALLSKGISGYMIL